MGSRHPISANASRARWVSAGLTACLVLLLPASPFLRADVRLVTPRPVAPEAAFCDTAPPDGEDRVPPCDVPGLPCGPLQAQQLPAGAQVVADLDGDSRADAVLVKRRGGRPGASYSAIYRATPQGFVLADYHEISFAIGPARPRVVVPMDGAAPVIEDGLDEPLRQGRSLSERRLRRWSGSRFVTLLRYCKNRQEIVPGAPARIAGQSILGIDLDNDGVKEIVIQGHQPPRVFRLTSDGVALREDPLLTRTYRKGLPTQRQAELLRDRALSLMGKGSQLPRAVSMLNRARLLAPQDVDIALALADGVLRMRHESEAIPLLQQTRELDNQRGETTCWLARAYQQTGEREKEKIALDACLSSNAPAAFKSSAEERLRQLAM